MADALLIDTTEGDTLRLAAAQDKLSGVAKTRLEGAGRLAAA